MVFLCQNTMINSSCDLANKDKNFLCWGKKIVPFFCFWKARLKNPHWYAAHDFVFNLYFEIGSSGWLGGGSWASEGRRVASVLHKSLVYWAQGEVCLSLESVEALKPQTWRSEPGPAVCFSQPSTEGINVLVGAAASSRSGWMTWCKWELNAERKGRLGGVKVPPGCVCVCVWWQFQKSQAEKLWRIHCTIEQPNSSKKVEGHHEETLFKVSG